MLEAVIKPNWPDDFKRIIDITNHFSKGWRDIHNPDPGQQVADNLTTTEFAAAILAACGWTGQEVGDHRNISAEPSSTIFPRHRQDLGQYMLH